MPRIEMARLDGKDLEVKAFGGGQVASSVRGEGLLKQLGSGRD